MNKQELIERIEGLKNLFGSKSEYIKIDEAIRLISELDEPQKPVVPPIVSVWYLINKDNLDENIAYLCMNWKKSLEKSTNDDALFNWMSNTDNFIEILINMHRFGYEVEKEMRYKVVMPNVSSSGGVLTRIKHDDSWIWIDTLGTIVEGRTHTRKELEEAGFSWVFDCEGIEVEEVEE